MRQLAAAMSAAALFIGCGKSIATKEDAATAMNGIASTGQGARGGQSWNGIDVNLTLTGKTGTATVTGVGATYANGVYTSTMTIVFKNYSATGKNTYDGSVTYASTATISGTSVSVALKMTGDVTMTGEYDSHVTFDITETASVTQLSQTSGTVTVTMNGTVTANGKTFTFANEAMTVTATSS